MKKTCYILFALLLVVVTLTTLTACSANCTAPNGAPSSNKVIDATEPELAKAIASVELVRKGSVETTTPKPGVKISKALFTVKDSAGLEAGVASLFEGGPLMTTCILTCSFPGDGFDCHMDGCDIEGSGGCSDSSCGMDCTGTCKQTTTKQRR